MSVGNKSSGDDFIVERTESTVPTIELSLPTSLVSDFHFRIPVIFCQTFLNITTPLRVILSLILSENDSFWLQFSFLFGCIFNKASILHRIASLEPN
jgi:hypothetical protein